MSNTALAVIGEAPTGLAIYDRVDPLQFIESVGKIFWITGAGGAKKKEDGELLALACLCERKTIFEINREFHLMEGKLSMRADAMLARFRERGGKHEWINQGKDGKAAEIELTYDGQTLVSKYTIEEAEAAKLIKSGGGWEKNRPAMLRARAVSEGVRMIAPEVVAGFYTPEENEDISTDNGKPAPAATAETAATVKRRSKELKEMNAQASQSAASTTSATSATEGEVIDAEVSTVSTVATAAKAEASATTKAAETPSNATATVTDQATDTTAKPADQASAAAAAAFDPTAPESATTATLLEIDFQLNRIAQTRDWLVERLKAKNPQVTSLEVLSDEGAKKIVEMLGKYPDAKK